MEFLLFLFSGLAALCLGVFLATRLHREARLFSLVAFGAGLYVIALGFLFRTELLVFSHLVIMTGALALMAALAFALSYRRASSWRAYLLLAPMALVALLAPAGLFIAGIRHAMQGIEPVQGPLMVPLAVLVIVHDLVTCAILLHTARRAEGTARTQAVLVLVSFAVILASIFVCNVLAPVIGVTTMNGATAVALLGFLACVTYGLSVEKLFDVELVTYNAFVHGIGPLSTLGGIGAAVGLLALTGVPFSRDTWIAVAIVGALAGTGFADSLRPWTADHLRRFLYPQRLTPEQRAAQEAERRLVAEIAHGLQTPLAVLCAEVDRNQDLSAPMRKRVIRSIDDLSDRMSQLIAFARAGVSVPQDAGVVRLDTLGLEVVEYVQVVAHERGVLLFTTPFHKVAVQGRADDLTTLITNLLSNALEHAARGPRVHEVFMSIAQDDEDAVLTITDTGPGMSEEERARATEPLWRAPDARAGTGMGLGLAIVRQVAHAHGGSLTLSAREGGGAEAVVRLPARTAKLLH